MDGVMELRVLNYFLVIAREENITKAAQILHISQPTLSRQLMQLEEEFGVKLFTRSNHNIILTEQGMLLRRRAQELVSLAEKTKRELNEKEELSGEITIGSGELMAFSHLAKIISEFQKKHPLVLFDIYSGNADSIKDRIDRGLIDVSLLLAPVDIGKYDFLEMPGEEQWGVFVSEQHPLAHQSCITPSELINEKIVMTKRTIVQNAIAGWFDEDYEKLNIIETYNLMGNAALMVQQDVGIAIGLKRNCSYDGVRFLPMNPPLTGKTFLVWKKNQMEAHTLSAFLEFAKKYSK